MLERNAKVYLAARNRDKAQAAIDELERQTGKKPTFLQLDLANLDSVRKAAEEFKSCVYAPSHDVFAILTVVDM